MNRSQFFSLNLKQPVNQWLGMGLLVAMCFWVVIYYFANSTSIIGNGLVKIAQTDNSQSLAE